LSFLTNQIKFIWRHNN